MIDHLILRLGNYPQDRGTRPIRHTIAMFQRWTGAGYWLAIRKGGPRYDLEGNVRGEITPAEQARAEQDLTTIHERKAAKHKAPGVTEGTQPQASPAAAPSQ
jgi:sRNA-binding protein